MQVVGGGVPVMPYGAQQQQQQTVQVTRYGTSTSSGGLPTGYVTAPHFLTGAAPTTVMHTTEDGMRLVGQPTVYTTSQPTVYTSQPTVYSTHPVVTATRSVNSERFVHPSTYSTTTYGDPAAFVNATNGAYFQGTTTSLQPVTFTTTPQLLATSDQAFSVDPSTTATTIAQQQMEGWGSAAALAAAQNQQQQALMTSVQPMMTTVPMTQQAFVSGSKTVKQWVNGQLVNSETQNW